VTELFKIIFQTKLWGPRSCSVCGSLKPALVEKVVVYDCICNLILLKVLAISVVHFCFLKVGHIFSIYIFCITRLNSVPFNLWSEVQYFCAPQPSPHVLMSMSHLPQGSRAVFYKWRIWGILWCFSCNHISQILWFIPMWHVSLIESCFFISENSEWNHFPVLNNACMIFILQQRHITINSFEWFCKLCI
jgi:hypothetical protein